ncbi:hypothetical protein AB0D10_39470 [Kitasatospora sp. NPDC048545]|uniref:hypothetical protein n=1 Tax=Kitasatospora sp. NPDC048545 TaxID=3157208 RepID=UPI0033D439F4
MTFWNQWRVVVDEADRAQWVWEPLRSVGPLRFGMAHDDATEAVAGFLEPSLRSTNHYGDVVSYEFALTHAPGGPALTAYYDAGRLTCVAVNARRGPQVALDGLRLVGRVPSELEAAFIEYTTTHGHELRYGPHADPGTETLGVVLRAQRAGDVVLSRPVFVAHDWADRCVHVPESRIPDSEWTDRHY